MQDDDKFGFSSSASTAICLETPSSDNPFICESRYLSGYDNIALAQHRSLIDVILLLFNLELPDPEQARLLEMLMVGLITPGNRHPATRAAQIAGITKSNPEHILPVALMTGGGDRHGAAEVQRAQIWLGRQLQKQSEGEICEEQQEPDSIPPGFGTQYGGQDKYVMKLAGAMCDAFPWADTLQWARLHAGESDTYGLLDTGLAAAVFEDLKIGPREGVGLFQLISAPGLVAQGLEQSHKPITHMPLLEDDAYDYVAE